MPDFYNFYGDSTTYFGFFGVVFTLVLVIIIFNRWFNSPLNR